MSSVPYPAFVHHDHVEDLHSPSPLLPASALPRWFPAILTGESTWQTIGKSAVFAVAVAAGTYVLIRVLNPSDSSWLDMWKGKASRDPKRQPKPQFGAVKKLKMRTGEESPEQLELRAKMTAIPKKNTHTTVAELRLYPIKSCCGIKVDSFTCGDMGPQIATEFGTVRDRGWMLVTKKNIFLTQRRKPRMCFIQPSIEGPYLVINAPGMSEPLRVPIEVHLKDVPSDKVITVSVWGTDIAAVDCGDEASEWFSRYLEDTGLRLLCHPVELGGRYCQNGSGLEVWDPSHDRAAFQDLAPFLLLSQESVADLNTRGGLDGPVPWINFRPNILVSGCPPYDEDDWDEFALGEAEFRKAKLCTRCVLTTVDTTTGKFRKDILEVLRSYRVNQTPAWSELYEDHPLMAINLSINQLGRISVGDTVRHLSACK